QQAAAAEAASALATQQFEAFKSSGASVSETIARQQEADRKAAQERAVFEAQRQDLSERRARGAYGQSEAELKAFGTPEAQPGPYTTSADEAGRRTAAQREAEIDKREAEFNRNKRPAEDYQRQKTLEDE